MFNFKKNKYYLSVFAFLILLLVFIGFQNCSKINLHGITPPQTQTAPLPTPPQPTTINIDSSVTPITTATPVYSNCSINVTWWPGVRNVAQPGGGVGLQCIFTASAQNYFIYKFHTPTLDDAQAKENATMGYLVLNHAFFAITANEPSNNQVTVAPSCSNNGNVFLNWALHGASTDAVVGARTDVCFLEPDKDYWIVTGQPSAAAQTSNNNSNCQDLGTGQSCLYQYQVNWDAIVVNEGYDEPLTCQYQKNDPIFAKQTLVATYTAPDGNGGGWGPDVTVSGVSPNDTGFKNALIAQYPGRDYSANSDSVALGNISLDIGVLNPLYHGNPSSQILSLKFHAPKFGENAAAVRYSLGIYDGFQSRVGPFASQQSFSECPGDFTSLNSKKMIFMSGYNLLQANGHYRNQDTYTMSMGPNGFPTGIFQTTDGVYHVLRPDTDYYWNVQTGSSGCTFGPANPPSSNPYCATGITSNFRPQNAGQLFFLNEQN